MKTFPRMKFRNKYNARKMETADGKFDSVAEWERWLLLKAMENDGEIKGLERQVPYVLIPKQMKDGKVLFREMKYVADFKYVDVKSGETVVEDVKGLVLPEFKIKQNQRTVELLGKIVNKYNN